MPRVKSFRAISGTGAVSGRRLGLVYARLKRQVLKLGYACLGSLTRHRMRCGKSSCACHKDPGRRHGPYVYWTRKVGGRTQGRKVPAGLVPAYAAAIRNGRRLRKLFARMVNVSLEALSHLRSEGAPRTKRRK